MEKIIELLNEFETPKSWIVFKSYDDYDWTFYWVDCDWETEIAWSDALICSKNFKFIERLVENNKINSTIWFENYNGWTLSFKRELVSKKHENIIRTHTILMILSIQDNPLKFLSELLK